MNIEVRQGIRYFAVRNDGKRDAGCGLVIDVCDDLTYVLPVDVVCKNGVRVTYCYDEPNASPLHKHNVRLKSSPDVFTDINFFVGVDDNYHFNNAYVHADCDVVDEVTATMIVALLDDGAKISDSDWDEVCNHLLSTQPQKEFTHHGYRQGSDKVADISKDDDTQFDV